MACTYAVTRRAEVCSIGGDESWQHLVRKRTGEEQKSEIGGLALLIYSTLTLN